MMYRRLAETFNSIESTTKRTAMTEYLSELLREAPLEDIGKVVYLIQGKLYPGFVGIEIGIAEKYAVRAVSLATGLSTEEINTLLVQTGDIGSTAYYELEKATKRRVRAKQAEAASPEALSLQNTPLEGEPLSVQDVYLTLDKIAKTSGVGSVELKIGLLADLLKRATPLEAKYIARTVTGKLRLGVADMTVLDALAIVYGGGRAARPAVERAYNLTSDLGRVATAIKAGGLEAVEKINITIGEPIRPMLAERLQSPAEILAKLGGECVVEYKYDGERVQIHKDGNNITLFSRRIENITSQYPDIVELVASSVKAETAILEGEIVAFDAETGENRPFQELMRRRRKHKIEEMAKEYPAAVFFFDCLFLGGRDLAKLSFLERRAILQDIINPTTHARIVEFTLAHSVDELERFFEQAIQDGTEGVVCKAIGKHSTYQAGSRGWLWIKYKREYRSEMTDTVDLVVVGAYYGRGRRAGVYGSLLMAIYSPETDTFKTITRLGAGFTDKDLGELPQMLDPNKIPDKHPRVEAKIRPDVWFVPALVLEIIGAEITLSPLHMAAYNRFRDDSGLAIRFPRFTGRYRPDKAPEDATTEQEIVEMYESRLKKVAS